MLCSTIFSQVRSRRVLAQWTRMRFPDDSKEDFYFCELTNSFSLTITDYKTDVRQSDTSEDRFSLATGGFLADEMGLVSASGFVGVRTCAFSNHSSHTSCCKFRGKLSHRLP